MKLLLENWREYLNEAAGNMSRDNFKCPGTDSNRGFKGYYYIDRENPPRLKDILNCWARNNMMIYDSNVNTMKPAYYSLEEVAPYREYQKDKLRYLQYPDGLERYKQLKQQIAEEGIKTPIIVFFGRNGVAKVGEGNHRHQIATELGLDRIPVRFVFWGEVHRY
jgi:hypothetical protein